MTLPPHPTAPRQPALDGLRGLSVLLVLCFHGGWDWMTGGYVGVSVFFTLSGFLITRLLLDEHRATGRIDLGRFWSRRVRRLMPAALACVVVVLLAKAAGAFDSTIGLRTDVLGALGQVANWVALSGTTSYAEQIAGAAGPLDHFWSLAIEEQFYWLWPLAMLWVVRRRRPAVTLVLMALVAGVTGFVVAAVWGGDAAYWATPARAGEILVGAAAAGMLHARRSPLPRGTWVVGPSALLVIVYAAVTWPSSSGPAYEGWLAVFALASCALVVSLTVPSPWASAFSWRPLVALGTVSYGVYLYHWPVFLFLRRADGHADAGTFVLQVAVTVAIAALSYLVVEQPIRRGVALPRRDPAFALGAVALTAAAALVLPIATVDPFANPELAAGQLGAVTELAPLRASEPPPPRSGPADGVLPGAPTTPTTRAPRATTSTSSSPVSTGVSTTTTVPATAPTTAVEVQGADLALPPAPSRPVRILVVGDSVAWSLGNGLVAWADAHPGFAQIGQSIAVSCGFVRTGFVPNYYGLGYETPCNEMLDVRLPEMIASLQPDVVVLMSTRIDVETRLWSPDEPALPSTDPIAVARRVEEYRAFTQRVLDLGAPQVIWVKPPLARRGDLPDQPMMDTEAMASLHATIDEVVAGTGPQVTSVDLAAWYPAAGFDDEAARPDGLHFQPEPATVLAERYLGPAILRAALTPAG